MKYRLLIFLLLFGFIDSFCQGLGHGDVRYRASNVHAGNLVRITFYNNGTMGNYKGDQSINYPGEWPIGTGYVQVGYASPYVMAEVKVSKGKDPITGIESFEYLTPAIFSQGWDPNAFSHNDLGTFLGFEPLPGFLNLTQKESDPKKAVAMSNKAFTWPPYWPDRLDDQVDAGWKNHWNGYFGKDQLNADEESYYVVDDYQFKKALKGIELPKPILAEPNRGGLGLRMGVRGLQWSNPDAEDCIFWLFDLTNIGRLNLEKTLFGFNVGASSGGLIGYSNTVYNESDARYYREKGLAVNFEHYNKGTNGYTPVPWVGYAYLESPGNPYDGIDNDGDGNTINTPGGGTGKIITPEDFVKVYKVGDPIVLIDYDKPDLPRTVSTMPAEGIKFTRNGQTYVMKPNTPLIETPRNGIDENLNGLIDESDGAMTQDSVKYYLYIKSPYNNQDYLSKNYITGDGLKNLMIDERRDDGIDNDGDWDIRTDDVGLDGKGGTGDFGEGDGKPTSAWQSPKDFPKADGKPNIFDLVNTNLTGEPNIDVTDVHESDQIGLTNFKFFVYGTLAYSNDEQMWEFSRPGYLDSSSPTVGDYDYVCSSGFFPINSGQKQFFSVALVFGWDERDILRNKDVIQKIYNANYNFAQAPNKPNVRAVAGDHQVTLYWDDKAEESFDRFLKTYNFEGYKIYKATYPTFEDAGKITDGLGYDRFKKPLAIYDKIDGVYGYFPKDFGSGVLFNLGNENGLVHSFVDKDVQNGVRYFYAVTAYSKGDLSKNIGPTETTMYVNVDQNGRIQFGENVVAVTPQASALGYEAPKFDITPRISGKGITNGTVGVNIVNPDLLSGNDEYEIQFLDQAMDGRHKGLIPNETTGFVLRNLTQKTISDTVWIKDYQTTNDGKVLVRNLYDDSDGDPTTFTKLMNGMEIYVKNPVPGVVDMPEIGIRKGVLWSKNIDYTKTYEIRFDRFQLGGFQPGTAYPRQYEVQFFNEIVDTSDQIGIPLAANGKPIPLPRVPVNFKVYDKQSGKRVRFGFVDSQLDPKIVPKGFFSAKDNIIFYEKLKNDSTLITYSLLNNANNDTVFYKTYGKILGKGDTLSVYPDFPFNGETKFHYKIQGQKVNQETAKRELSRVKVVPNPYVVSALWEPRNPYSNGRGERKVEFINLPQKCTIRIFAVDGTLVKQLEHDSAMRDGSESWDLMSKDNMDIAYGIYIYHIDAPGIGEHVGRMLVIK